jgi:hypothetical protein
MNVLLEKKIEVMSEYYESLRRDFKWEGDLSKHLIALNYTLSGKSLDSNEIMELKRYLKEQTSTFSPFRGSTMFTICGMLCANADHARVQLDQMIYSLDEMKKAGFKQTTYLPTALYALTNVSEDHRLRIIRDAADIYSEMRRNHPFLTSGDDYALSVLLADSKHSPDMIETYYKALAEVGFSKGNGMQTLSHILSYHGEAIEKAVEKCKATYEVLRANKIKLNTMDYPALGVLSLVDNEEMLTGFIDVFNHLKKRKRYKWLAKNMTIMMAAALVVNHYTDELDDVTKATLQVSVQAIIAAQQAVMVAAVAATCVASTS